MRYPKAFVVTLGLIMGLLSAPVFAVTIVTPGAAAGTEGNSNNGYPFNLADGIFYQQLYDASLFGGQSGTVDQILFRVDDGDASFAEMLNLEVRLSHTTVSPAAMSSTFANNVGADETVVFAGNVALSGTGGSGPNPFDVVLDVDDLFNYNGVDNLLLQISRISGDVGVQFDSVTSAFPGGDLVQRLWSDTIGAATGSMFGDRGLVTAFVIGPSSVPEPMTLLLLGLGLAGLGFARKPLH